MKQFLRGLFRFLFRLLYCVRLSGFENFPDRPHIIAPNHRYELDAPLLIAFLPMEFAAMGKAPLERSRLFGPLFRRFHGIPVQRDGQDLTAIRQAIATLQDYPLIIFAEGTTTEDRGRLPAKAGLGLIAKQADVPIVPLSIKTTYRLFSPIELIAHPPLNISDFGYERYSSAIYRQIGEKVLDIAYQPMGGAE